MNIEPESSKIEQPMAAPFLDVPSLLNQSIPQSRVVWFWYVTGGILLLILAASYFGPKYQAGSQVTGAMSMLGWLAIIAVMGISTWLTARNAQREQSQLAAVEELIQLRQWGQAAVMLDAMLSQPARTPQARNQALVYLAAVLARYHRFADSVSVYDYLLDNSALDGEALLALRLGRAMALLHEERLFDADRAIGELRRTPGAGDSGGLALVEIYRDVKTGHPREAIETFAARLPVLRRQLGHRLADAYALTARAYDLVGEEAQAAAAFASATLLSPAAELRRRYAEVAALGEKYRPAAAPGGGA